jgi:hypothetical protein
MANTRELGTLQGAHFKGMEPPTRCRVYRASSASLSRGVYMKQNYLYLLVGALVVAVIVLGVYVFQEETKPSGVELRIDESGVSVEQN